MKMEVKLLRLNPIEMRTSFPDGRFSLRAKGFEYSPVFAQYLIGDNQDLLGFDFLFVVCHGPALVAAILFVYPAQKGILANRTCAFIHNGNKNDFTQRCSCLYPEVSGFTRFTPHLKYCLYLLLHKC